MIKPVVLFCFVSLLPCAIAIRCYNTLKQVVNCPHDNWCFTRVQIGKASFGSLLQTIHAHMTYRNFSFVLYLAEDTPILPQFQLISFSVLFASIICWERVVSVENIEKNSKTDQISRPQRHLRLQCLFGCTSLAQQWSLCSKFYKQFSHSSFSKFKHRML